MELDHLNRDERASRRAAGRRATRRRRRLGALAAALSVGAIATGLTLETGRGGPERANLAPEPKPRRLDSVVGQRTAESRRGRLGSGKQVTFAFGGDVHFESPIRERLTASPRSVLAPVEPVLGRADVAMVNLETAVTERGTPQSKAYTFRAPPSAFEALLSGGVDVVSIANNHGLDFGLVGLRDTLRSARRAGLPVVGGGASEAAAYAPYRTTVKGQRIAILGATQVLDDRLQGSWTAGVRKPGLASAKRVERLARAVREARLTSDTVVVFLHWGVELEACPSADQRRLARRLVGAGADLVVGGHAHVLQGAGRVGDALVAYGLGNFVFYAFRDATSQSGVLEVRITGARVDGYRFVPARISNGIPQPLTGKAARRARLGWNALRGCAGLRP